MEGILKRNDIATIGGVTPQGAGIQVLGQIGDWIAVRVDDSAISTVQEFHIQPVEDGFIDAINGPRQEGAYNSATAGIRGFGDKMRLENNPGQVIVGVEGIEDGTPLMHPDSLDDRSKKNYNADDVAPFKKADAFIRKYDSKSILRNQIRGNIVDVEDDIADTKVATQFALYYFAHEWNTRTEAEKNANKSRANMDKLAAKLLSDSCKMRADLANGMSAIDDILVKEAAINKFVTDNYSYNADRGA